MPIIPLNYAQTFAEIKQLVIQARHQALFKVNIELITMYINLGQKILVQTQQGRGDGVIDTLSHDLQIEFPGVKGFSARNLRRMKMIASELSQQDQILPQAVAELPWGHISLIFEKVKSTEERLFYLTETQENHRSRTTLQKNIVHDLYRKQPIQNNFNKILTPETVAQMTRELKDEYDLSFLELEQEHTERQLENAMVDNIVQTLGQFGKDFAFMGRQFRVEISEKEYFIDMLFYHRKLKCMIAIELKTGEFLPQYTQQLNRYLHILDKQVKYAADNPSIGILICRSKDKILVEYALELATQPMGVATYTYNTLPAEIANYLPNEETIRKLLDDTM